MFLQFLRLLIILLLLQGCLFAQNLVPNPDFEDYNLCPIGYHPFNDPLECLPWVSATSSSSDYFNSCCSCSVSVPVNLSGVQDAHSGVGYTGIYAATIFYREYIMAPLSQPLEAGVSYYVEFWISPGETFCAIKTMGALFTTGPPVYFNMGPLDYTPQIEVDEDYLNNYEDWTRVSGCFIANGGENFITIGNFDIQSGPFDPDCSIPPPTNNNAYYFIDDVLVEPSSIDEINFDFGEPVSACYEFEIDPGIQDVLYHWEDGSTNPTLVVYESGTYAVTITDICHSVIDSLEVEILGGPPVDIPDDQVTICSPEVYEIELDPDAGSYAWSDGTSGPNITIDQSGIYEVVFDNGCEVSTDQIEVVINEGPEPFSLGPDFILCPGQEFAFSLDPSLGEFFWQDGSDEATYIIDGPGVYELVIFNDCGEESDEVEVIGGENPSIDLGLADQFLCEGASLSFSLDPEAGNYTWQDGSISSTYVVNEAGVYFVTLSNSCGQAFDTVNVLQQLLPEPELGSDQFLCQGDSIILQNSGSTGNYVWQDLSTSEELLVTEAGSYSLTVTNACGTASDSIVISAIASLDTLELGNDFSICPGETVVLDPGIDNANFLWQDLSTADTLIIHAGGSYALTISNQCDIYSDTIHVVEQNDPPVLDLEDQVALCQDSTITIVAGITGVSYLWSDGSSLSEIVVSSPGNYSLTISNACGSDTDTVIVIDNGHSPEVSLGSDINFCPGEVVIITPAYQNVDTWLWSDGSTADTLLVSQIAVIAVEVSNACGSTSDTLIATLLESTPTFNLGVDTSICLGESIILQPDIQGISVEWSDGSHGEQLEVVDQGTIHATLSGECGTTSDTIEISLLPSAPILDLGTDQSLCPGDSITIEPGLIDVNYLWQDGTTETLYSTTQPGEIILIVSNSCGQDVDTLIIVESTEGPQVDLGPDIIVCEGDTIILQAGVSGVNYVWQDQSSLPQFEVVEAGLYVLKVSNHCGSNVDSVLVTYQDVPVDFDLGRDTVLCPGESIVLHAPFTTDNLTWQDGSGESTFTATAGQLYSLNISNDCGTKSDEILVSEDDRIPSTNLDDEYSLCPEEIVTLDVTQAFAATYLWNTGSPQPSIEIKQPGEYSVTIFAPCQDLTEDVIVLIGEDCVPREIYIPNIFSPNGDGINDEFEVTVHPELEVMSLHGTIYDRWGNVLYESTGQTFSWDGSFDQKTMMPGVYVFRLEFEYLLNGKEYNEIRVGDVSLIR